MHLRSGSETNGEAPATYDTRQTDTRDPSPFSSPCTRSTRPFRPGALLRPGTWLVECGPRLVHFTSDGTYTIDDQGRLAVSPADSGAFEQDDDTVTFTSGEDSEGCEAGSVLVIEDPVAFEAPLGDVDQPGPFGNSNGQRFTAFGEGSRWPSEKRRSGCCGEGGRAISMWSRRPPMLATKLGGTARVGTNARGRARNDGKQCEALRSMNPLSARVSGLLPGRRTGRFLSGGQEVSQEG